MNSTGIQLGLIGFLALILLLADRYIRIGPALQYSRASLEPFQMPVLRGGRARACGAGLQSCPEGTKCGNGLCINTDPKPLEEKRPLPVLPARIE
jgi:hypothetical protein